jgi:glycosyltransferase involved in cell wall biosynthesis
MKLAVFHHLPPGGAKRVAFEQVKALSQQHQIFLFEIQSDFNKFLDLKKFSHKHRYYTFTPKRNLPFFFGRLQQDSQVFFKLRQLHRQIAADINQLDCQLALIHPDHYTQAPFILSFLKIPSLYYCHELLRLAYEKELQPDKQLKLINRGYEIATRSLRKSIDRQNAQAASLILTNSHLTQKKIKQAYQRQVSVCHPGVNTQVFKPQGKKSSPPTILLVGEKHPLIGYNLIKAALELIPAQQRPQLKVISFSRGQPRLTDPQLARQYSQASITVCLSLNEPFGLVALESMACATPVIALNQGGYKETVIDNQTGFLIKRHPQLLAQKIIKLLKNPQLVHRLGQAGRNHVTNHFSWKKHHQCLRQAFKQLA